MNMIIGHTTHLLSVTDSTNNYAMEKIQAGEASHGMVYMALEQTAGKGQRGKKWLTEPGMNIIMTVVLNTRGLKLDKQFLLSASIALGCCDFLKNYVQEKDARIKWPNDLYWHDRKAGGILIENRIQPTASEPVWTWAIAGIGININQIRFPNEIADRATSLRMISGRTEDILELVPLLCTALNQRWQQLISTDGAALLNEYNGKLYRKDQLVLLKKGDMTWETKVVGVDGAGLLITRDATTHRFTSGEIEWIP